MLSVHLDELERIGGALCLDFVNTVDPRYGAEQIEYLPDYQALLDWSVAASSLEPEEAERLRGFARDRPQAARNVHRRAIALREALFELLRRETGATRAGALVTLNAELARARRQQIRDSGHAFESEWPEPGSLDWVLWPIADSAAEMLTSPRRARVRECDGERCGWLFLDTSKAGRRRWCSMADCGNLAKALRRRAVRSTAPA
jgi:predicted RNA-binding Zn ribbon-like protein